MLEPAGTFFRVPCSLFGNFCWSLPPAELTKLRLFAPSWIQGWKKLVSFFQALQTLNPCSCILFDCVMQSLIALPPLPLQRRISFPAAGAEQPADRHRSVGEITSYPLLRWKERKIWWGAMHMYLHARHIMALSRFPILASVPLFFNFASISFCRFHTFPDGLLHKCFYKWVVRNATIANLMLQSGNGHFVQCIFFTSWLERTPLDSHIAEHWCTFSFCSSPQCSLSLVSPNNYNFHFSEFAVVLNFPPWIHGNCSSTSAILRKQLSVPLASQVQYFPASREIQSPFCTTISSLLFILQKCSANDRTDDHLYRKAGSLNLNDLHC